MNNNQMRDEITKILNDYHNQIAEGLPITYNETQMQQLESYVDSYNRFNEISEEMKQLETKDTGLGENNVSIENAEGKSVFVNAYDAGKYIDLRKEKISLKKAQTKAVNYFESHTIADIMNAVKVEPEPIKKETQKEKSQEVTTQSLVEQVEKYLNELSNRSDFTAEQATAITILASQITQNKLANLNASVKVEPTVQTSPKMEESKEEKKEAQPALDYQNMSIDELKKQLSNLKAGMDELRNLTGKENSDRVSVGNRQHESYEVPKQYKEQAQQIYNEMQNVRKIIEEKTKEQAKATINQQNTAPVKETVSNTKPAVEPEVKKEEQQQTNTVSNSNSKLFGVHNENDPLFKDIDKKESSVSSNYYRIYDEEGERLNREYEQQQNKKQSLKVTIKNLKKPDFNLKQRIMENWKQTKEFVSVGFATLAALANNKKQELEAPSMEDYEIEEPEHKFGRSA